MIAYCGLNCSDCLAYKATRANSDDLRKATAEEWQKQFNANITYKDINCLGCQSNLLFSHCQVCEIRKCASSKSIENCGSCESFSCSKLDEILNHVPEARKNLEK